MCVGVFPDRQRWRADKLCLPHVRGGVSAVYGLLDAVWLSSPCAWGCFPEYCTMSRRPGVFPMCVGVFPLQKGADGEPLRLPHVRGGVSTCLPLLTHTTMSSPCAWGCFQLAKDIEIGPGVFPMCVGVFLEYIPVTEETNSLPHVRGGVSAVAQTSSLSELTFQPK